MRPSLCIRKSGLACWKACIRPVWHIVYKSEDYFWKWKRQCLYSLKKLKWTVGIVPTSLSKLVIVETKSIEGIGPLQVAQVLTYLRFLGLRYGLILNFDVLLLKDGIRRVLNGYGDTDYKCRITTITKEAQWTLLCEASALCGSWWTLWPSTKMVSDAC